MKKFGRYEFPESENEFAEWEPTIAIAALHQHVLCAAKTRIEGAWCAYCANVPGFSHHAEFGEVLRHGDKIPERIALAIFPQFKDVPYAT